jgi:hypothetical protein
MSFHHSSARYKLTSNQSIEPTRLGKPALEAQLQRCADRHFHLGRAKPRPDAFVRVRPAWVHTCGCKSRVAASSNHSLNRTFCY